MLILTRKRDEAIVIDGADGPVTVKVLRVKGNRIRLGIEAPRSVPIRRGELQPHGTDRQLDGIDTPSAGSPSGLANRQLLWPGQVAG